MLRLSHLSLDERHALAQLGMRRSAIRKSVPRRTIGDVARAARLNASFVGELERARVNPNFVVFVRLAAALETDVRMFIVPPRSAAEIASEDVAQHRSLEITE